MTKHFGDSNLIYLYSEYYNYNNVSLFTHLADFFSALKSTISANYLFANKFLNIVFYACFLIFKYYLMSILLRKQ